MAKNTNLLPALGATIAKLVGEFEEISSSRKEALTELTRFVEERYKKNEKVFLNFICTHNSRRSHMTQIWAQVAAYYYNIPDVAALSGGTEATAFNPKAIGAMKVVGFDIAKWSDGANPVYEVRYASDAPALRAFSKKYDDPVNHAKDFAAIMTCSDADENCPLIPGASVRIALHYRDPKDFDGTHQETDQYRQTVNQIGKEILFAFSLVNLKP